MTTNPSHLMVVIFIDTDGSQRITLRNTRTAGFVHLTEPLVPTGNLVSELAKAKAAVLDVPFDPNFIMMN